jgi:hypothetical protein
MRPGGARRAVIGVVVCAVLAAALAYLRDPPWLLSQTSGLRGWETAATGERFRWMGGHASFFVPAAARDVDIPIRTTFDRPQDWPIVVTVTIDDRPVDRLVLSDAAWRHSVVRMSAGMKAGATWGRARRVRRIDIRVDRTREDNRGAAIGEVRVN